MIKHDRGRAISCYQQLVDGHEVLLTSEYSREFLYWALRKNFLTVKLLIEAMMQYPDEVTQQRGAELACIAAISPTVLESEGARLAAQDIANITMSGPVPWRRGAARVYSENLTRGAVNECLPKVLALLGDDDEQVRQSIGSVFFNMRVDHFHTLRPFIESYVCSVSLPEDQCLNYLWENGLLAPAWSLATVRYIATQTYTPQQGELLSGINELIRLVLKIYNDPTSDVQMRREAMNVFDILMERFSRHAQSVLSEWDSR